MKFHSNFIFACRALRNVIQRHFERTLLAHIEAQNGPAKLGRAPVPSFETQLFLQHIDFVGVREELGDLVLFRLLEADVSVQGAVFQEHSDAPGPGEVLKVDGLEVRRGNLIDFAGFAVFEDDVLVGHFKFAWGL